MTKRIFWAILTVAAAILAACLCIIIGVLYNYFAHLSEQQMQTQAALIAQAVETGGEAYFDELDSDGYRITWIAQDGTVLYDTTRNATEMESHADREEFMEAQLADSGESFRYSSTLTERMLYYAKRLSDGSVVRVSSTQSTIFALVLGMFQPVLVVLIVAVILSALLAHSLSRRIVKPLNEMNLDAPLENDAYEELSPLLTRIDHQHRQISAQLKELRRRQEEWDTISGSMNEGILLLNQKNIILSINKSAMRLFSTGRECIGQNFLTICRRLDVQEILKKSASGEKAELILELNGREYQANASPVLSGGEAMGTALLFFDVTDKARAEQLRREFTANVSHELKTPLHTISGSAEIIKNGLVTPEDTPRFINRIYTESQRMITLVEDIIRLSRLDEGGSDAPRELFSLKALAVDTVKRLEQQADAKSLTVLVSGVGGEISGVRPLVAELIYNLCDNAIKYNRNQGSVTLQIEDTPNEAILTVADTGIGIPADSQDRVFERFYRVDKSHSKAIGGTGLGLSIVKHIARMHNAPLELNSKLDEGTVITVRFPK